MTSAFKTMEAKEADAAQQPHVSAPAQSRSGAVSALFEALDRAGMRYCVSHGYETYPGHIPSDVDCIIDPAIRERDLIALVRRSAAEHGFKLVRRTGYHFVLAGRDERGRQALLTFDFSTECEFANLPFYSAAEFLWRRQRNGTFWVPRVEVEFAAYLARTITRRSLDLRRGKRLSLLFQAAPDACEREIARFWSGAQVALIASAAASGDWAHVREQSDTLVAELHRRVIWRAPWRFLRNSANAFRRRFGRALHPPGVYLALLGPDGAGKSSVIDALGLKLEDLFPRAASYGFVPEFMQRALHGRNRRTDTPHALRLRSPFVSVARALLYWLPYYTVGYLGRHIQLIRSSLVLNDRHFIDVLVDTKRYRYGGPRSLLLWIWGMSVKPDLVVLLDAPAEVLYERKQEMRFDEVVRQRAAYTELVRSLNNGHIVDTRRPLHDVVDQVAEIVTNFVAQRGVRRGEWP